MTLFDLMSDIRVDQLLEEMFGTDRYVARKLDGKEMIIVSISGKSSYVIRLR